MPIPTGNVTADQCDSVQPDWVLPGYSRAQFDELLEGVARSPAIRALFEAAVTCDASGCTVHPSRELVEALSPDSRRSLYTTLARFDANRTIIHSFSRNTGSEPWSQMEGLAPLARDLLTRLSWLEGENRRFADVADVCTQLPDDDARVRFIEALKGRESVTATVFVPPRADVEAMVRYWSSGSSATAVRPLIAAAAAQPSGGSVDVPQLLPAFARDRVNVYPAATAPAFDCFWTALHFSAVGDPDTRLYSALEFSQQLAASHVPVSLGEVTLGDVLVFRQPQGPALHAANYVASGIVFTKNGRSALRPYVLMRLSDVLGMYPHGTDIQAWRRRGA